MADKPKVGVLIRPDVKGHVRLSRAVQSPHANNYTPQPEPEPVVLSLKEASAADWTKAIKELVK